MFEAIVGGGRAAFQQIEELIMSLDNMSQLGGTRLDELVPYRYALQVGEIDVLVISDGVLPIPATTMAYNTDSSGLAVWLDGMFLPPDVLEALRFQDRSWGRWWTTW